MGPPPDGEPKAGSLARASVSQAPPEGRDGPGRAGRGGGAALPDPGGAPEPSKLGTGPFGAVAADFRQKLRALVLFRIVVATALLAATALMGSQQPGPAGPSPNVRSEALIYGLVAGVYLLSIAYAVALRVLRRSRPLTRLAYVQLAGDALFAALLVLLTGGTSSVFTFFFSLWIVLAAVLLYRPGAYFLATVSAVLLLGIGLVELGVLGAGSWLASLSREGLGGALVVEAEDLEAAYGSTVYNLTVNVVAFYVIAFLASYLADQLRRTDLKLQENRVSLEDLRALHENIVSSLQSGLITVNRSRQITYFNRVAEEVTGYRAEDVLYQDVTRYFADLKAIFRNEDKLHSEHEELTSQVLGGRLAYIRWTISPLRDARDRPIGHILVFEDVTRVRQMEEQVKRAEQLATLGKLAAAIAHEIRNPLASISGAIQVLGATLALEEDDRRLMDIVSRETDALNQWITDFLTYARPRIGERVPVDVARQVSDAVTVLKHDEKSARLAITLDAGAPALVVADPTYLKQVVWNILNNAVQAMPDGGELRVSVAPHQDDRGAFHRLSFRDTGVGIPADKLDRVTEPFFTTKEQGTGLGLATVYRIVAEHGGFLTLESDVGVGTTVIVDLPRHEAEAYAPSFAAAEAT